MRSSTTELDTSIVQPVIYQISLVRLDFDDDIIAWNSGFSDITFNSVTYLASGALSNISSTSEELGMKVSSKTVTLSGVKSEIVSLLLSEPYIGRKAYIYTAFVDEDLVFDLLRCKLTFVGTMDSVNGTIGATASFSVAIKSRLADWERSRNLRYTDVDHQTQYPGDKFMEFIPQISKKKIVWPRAAALLDPRD